MQHHTFCTKNIHPPLSRPKTLALIPARKQSKGIKDKNIQPILGHPLLAYSILAAKESGVCDEILLATDDEIYAQIGARYGSRTPYLRSSANARDDSKTISVILEALHFYKDSNFEAIILLQPTSPLRNAKHIQEAYNLFLSSNLKGVVSIHKSSTHPLLMRELPNFSTPNIPSSKQNEVKNLLPGSSTLRRQDMPPFYEINGAIYINTTKSLHPQSSLNDNPIGYIMPEERGIDIDTPLDLEIARLLAKILNIPTPK